VRGDEGSPWFAPRCSLPSFRRYVVMPVARKVLLPILQKKTSVHERSTGRAVEGLRLNIRSISSSVNKPQTSAKASISACPVRRSGVGLAGGPEVTGCTAPSSRAVATDLIARP